jgi:general stress protein 26
MNQNADLTFLLQRMKAIDVCLMNTMKESDRGFDSRPMSNNADVTFTGNSYFFTSDDTDVVTQLEKNDAVSLSFCGADFEFIHLDGKAHISKDKTDMESHWNDALTQWFLEGVDTPGICMIVVTANNIKYWHNEKNIEINL